MVTERLLFGTRQDGHWETIGYLRDGTAARSYTTERHWSGWWNLRCKGEMSYHSSSTTVSCVCVYFHRGFRAVNSPQGSVSQSVMLAKSAAAAAAAAENNMMLPLQLLPALLTLHCAVNSSVLLTVRLSRRTSMLAMDVVRLEYRWMDMSINYCIPAACNVCRARVRCDATGLRCTALHCAALQDPVQQRGRQQGEVPGRCLKVSSRNTLSGRCGAIIRCTMTHCSAYVRVPR